MFDQFLNLLQCAGHKLFCGPCFKNPCFTGHKKIMFYFIDGHFKSSDKWTEYYVTIDQSCMRAVVTFTFNILKHIFPLCFSNESSIKMIKLVKDDHLNFSANWSFKPRTSPPTRGVGYVPLKLQNNPTLIRSLRIAQPLSPNRPLILFRGFGVSHLSGVAFAKAHWRKQIGRAISRYGLLRPSEVRKTSRENKRYCTKEKSSVEFSSPGKTGWDVFLHPSYIRRCAKWAQRSLGIHRQPPNHLCAHTYALKRAHSPSRFSQLAFYLSAHKMRRGSNWSWGRLAGQDAHDKTLSIFFPLFLLLHLLFCFTRGHFPPR